MKLNVDLDKLLQDTVAGEEKAFRKIHDKLNNPHVWVQRDALLEALPIHRKSNSNVLTLRALILMIESESRTKFQIKEAELLLNQAIIARNGVALAHKAFNLITQADMVQKYEGMKLLKRAAELKEPLALSMGRGLFVGHQLDSFNDLITALEVVIYSNRPQPGKP